MRTCSGSSAEARRHLVAVDVQPLRRDVDVDAALAVRNRDARLRPEERLVLRRRLVVARDDDVSLGVGVAVPDQDRAEDVRARVLAVAVAHRRPVGVERLLLGRMLGVDDRLERLVGDDDRLGRPTRLLGMLGGHDGHRLAVVADAIDREHGLVGELEAVGLAARNVLVREHRVDAGHRDGLRDVDLEDARMGMRAAQGVAPQHPRGVEVARVGELPEHLRRRVGSRGRTRDADHRVGGALDDESGLRGGLDLDLGHPAAAALTASKIFW